ncbi:MAG: LysR family transcriptional regulator [Lachnospiraceae bacterium]|nr:LysR family transcriptional regulator [Lachnospiraceae bacterium]
MNVSQLECFVSLASTLNFVRTAEQLGLTQPAVSKQIKAIESELGVTLFERTSRSVSLTQIGHQFLPEATDMLNIFYRAKQRINSYYQTEKNVVRIGYSDPHAVQFISQTLKETFKISHENISPELVLDQTDANLSRLQKNQLDIVIGIRDAKFSDDSIVFSKVDENRFKFIIAKDHPFAIDFLKTHSIKKSDETLISSDEFWNIRQILDIPPYLLKTFFSKGHHIVPINDNLDNIICSNVNEAYGLVLAGIGYALVPEHLIIQHPNILFLNWKESPHASFGIYHKKQSNRQSPIYHFIKSAKSTMV